MRITFTPLLCLYFQYNKARFQSLVSRVRAASEICEERNNGQWHPVKIFSVDNKEKSEWHESCGVTAQILFTFKSQTEGPNHTIITIHATATGKKCEQNVWIAHKVGNLKKTCVAFQHKCRSYCCLTLDIKWTGGQVMHKHDWPFLQNSGEGFFQCLNVPLPFSKPSTTSTDHAVD